MSIQIGTGRAELNLNQFISSTDRERFILRSTIHSNLINLSSTTNHTLIVTDNYHFGKYPESFQLRQDSNVLLRINNTSGQIVPPMNLSSTLSVDGIASFRSNVFLDSNISLRGLQASNATITSADPLTSTLPVFRVARNNTSEAFTVFSDGMVRIPRAVGIGTNTPNPNTLLHVESNVLVSRTLFASNVQTNYIQSAINNNGVLFLPDRILLRGTTEILGDFSIKGNFTLNSNLSIQSVYVSDTTFTPRLYIANNATSAMPTFQMTYNGDIENGYTSNIMSVSIRPQDSNISAFVIDHHGRVGMGTALTNAILDLYSDSNHSADYVMRFRNAYSRCDNFVLDKNANMGIGTEASRHKLQVTHCDDILSIASCNLDINDPTNSTYIITYSSNPDKNALFGLYNYEQNVIADRPFVSAFSNERLVYQMSKDGDVTIGTCNIDTRYALDITPEKPARIPHLEAGKLVGNTTDRTIQCDQSSILDVNNFSACNLQIDSMNIRSAYMHYMFTSNYEIVGMKCFEDDPGLFSVTVSNFHFEGTGILFSDDLANDLQKDPISEGKLKIMVQDPPQGGISRGINIIGNQDTSIRVNSETSISYLELANLNTTGLIGLNVDGSMFVKHVTDDEPKIKMMKQGGVYLLGNTLVTDIGVGIQQTNTPITKSLQVRGDSLMTNFLEEPVLFVNGGTINNVQQRVGVCTDAPTYNLDVQGNFFARDNSRFNNSLNVISSVGIGTDVVPSSVLYVETQTLQTSNAVTINNKGSGFTLDVSSGNKKLVVDNKGNIGVGTTSPYFTLDVQGDLNFAGSLYQSGYKYISSQWTTTVGDDLYFMGNIGIGTQSPLYGLHLQRGSCFVGSNLTVGSNINVNGTVFAQGSFITTSDRTVKVDLVPIPGALDKVEKIQGYTYYRTDLHKREAGLIAQEVLDILPEVVYKTDSSLLSIAYGNMAGLFVEAIKELNQKIANLEKEVATLKAIGHTQ
jgi:hypothetical protein